MVTLTNYYDKFVLVCGGIYAECEIEEAKPLKEVIKYDIKQDEWSTCPDLQYEYINHSSVCINGNVYLFFGHSKSYEDGL